MLLVVTNRDDLTADWLVVELNERRARFERFNTEDYPRDVSMRWTPDSAARLALPGSEVDLAGVTSVWYRRPLAPRAPDDVDEELAEWAVREAQEALDGMWRTLDARWVNHPDANQAAGSKPEQLNRAARIGLLIAPTLVTNDAEQLREFAASVGPKLVCKPLYEGWIPLRAGELGFWTSAFSVGGDGEVVELGGEPYLFQALVDKSYDVRVTVIGSNVYAVGIGSQASPESKVDWRRGDVDQLDHWIEELPGEVARQCIQLVADYGLLFGAIDLARRPDGAYVFFELNPNGQWAWLEHRTGLPLRARLADRLLEARVNAQDNETTPGVPNAVADETAEHGQQPDATKRFRDRWPWRWLVWLALRVAGGYTAWVSRNTQPDPPDDAEPAVTHPWRNRRHVPAPARIFADWVRPLPLDPPWSFPQSVRRLWSQLQTNNDALADELLSDAEQLFAEADANVKSAEQRASTLQGAVAIAATVAVAAGGLLLEPTKIHGHGWRTAFAIGLAVLVLLLAVAGWRATQASARLGWFTTASDKDILVRARLPTAAMAKTQRAAYLLHGNGRNAELALLKVIYLRKAANWFRGAVVVLVILMAMGCVYVIDASGPSATSATPPAPSRLSPTFPNIWP